MRPALLLLLLLGPGLTAFSALAEEIEERQLTIKARSFNPLELDVPAGQKIKIVIKNEDQEAAEFESFELNREKVVPAEDNVSIYVGPLDPGSYPFFNDFDPAKAKGKIVAK